MAPNAPLTEMEVSESESSLDGAMLDQLRERIEERIAAAVQREDDEGEARCTAAYQDFKRWHDLYRGVTDRRHYEGAIADLNVPVTFENVEVLTANLHGMMFPSRNWLTAEPGMETEEIQAKMTAAVVQWHMEQARIRRKMRRGLSQNYLLCGTLLLRLHWKYEFGPTMKRVPTPDGGWTIVTAEEPTADHFDVDVIDLFSFRPSHMEAETIEDLDHYTICHVTDRSWLESRQIVVDEEGKWKSGVYFNIDQLTDEHFENIALRDPDHQPSRRGSMSATDTSLSHEGAKKIRRIERWGRPMEDEWWPELLEDEQARRMIFKAWQIDPDSVRTKTAKKWVIETAGDKVIRIQPNPTPRAEGPVVKVDCIPVMGQFWSMGIGEVNESQHIEANAKANQAMDEKTKALSGMVAIQRNGLDMQAIGGRWETALKWRPHGVLWTKWPVDQVIRSLKDIANTSSIGEDVVEWVTQRARNAVAANDVVQAQATGNTATENLSQQRFSMTRFQLYEGPLADVMEEEILPAAHAFIRLFGSDEQRVQVLGEDGIHQPKIVKAQDILGSVHFRLLGARHMREREVARGQWVTATGPMLSDPFLPPESHHAIHRETLRKFDIENPEKFIPDEQRRVLYETDPIEENQLLLSGVQPPVRPMDDHLSHLIMHEQAELEAIAEGYPVEILEKIAGHKKHHNRIFAEMMRQAQMMQMQAAMAPQPEEGPDGERPNAPGREEDVARSGVQPGQNNPNDRGER